MNVQIVWGRMSAPRFAITDRDLPVADVTDGWQRMADIVNCDSDRAFNSLVDMSRFEKMVVCEDDAVARRVVWSGTSRNVVSGYLPNGTQYTVRGSTQNMFVRDSNFPPRIGVDVQGEQRACDEQLAGVVARMGQLEGARREAARAFQEARDTHAAARRRALEAQRRRDEADFQLNDAERRSQQASKAAQPVSFDDFDRRIAKLEAAVAEAERALPALQAAVEAAEEGLRSAQAALSALDPRKEAAAKVINERTGELDAARDSAAQAKEKLAQCAVQAERGAAARKKVLDKAAMIQAVIDTDTALANTICPREEAEAIAVDPKEAEKEAKLTLAELVDKMDKKLAALEKSVEKEEQRRGRSLEQIEAEHSRAKKRMRVFSHNVDACRAPHKRLKRELKKSFGRVNECKEDMSRAVAHAFNARLGARGHSGRLVLDYDNQTLDLVVVFAGRTEGKVEDLRSLSGGERSFVQLAYVLALAEKAEGPFRAMDEWDVFMDAVNRKISFETLLKFADGAREAEWRGVGQRVRACVCSFSSQI